MKEYRNGWNNALDLGPAAPNLSEDLEWVLQSGQSDPALVAEGLLHTYHAPVLRLCIALEDQPERARVLHHQIFARAVNQAYRYNSKISIPLWFYTCLLQALPRVILRERSAHLSILLHVFAELDAEQLAALFKLKLERVQNRLSKLEKEPQAILGRAGLPAEMTSDLQAGTDWRQALRERYPAHKLEDEALEAMANEIVEQAEKRNAIHRRWVLLQELVLLLLAALAVAGLIMAADSFSSPPTTATPQRTVVVTRIVEKVVAPLIVVVTTPAPGPTPYPTPSPVVSPPRLPPLTLDSSPISILERLRLAETLWQTVWADVITVLYGPSGYLGPDRIHRTQLWLGETQARILSGPLQGPPQEFWVANQGQIYWKSRGSSARLPRETVMDSLKRPMMNELGLLFDPLQPLGAEWVDPYSWQIRIFGRDRVAGREALIIELLDGKGDRSARLWLDTQTSFVLRQQQYRPAGARRPAIEIIVTRVAFDLNFTNQALFDLDHQQTVEFANDPLGRPSRAAPTVTARANWESNPQPAYLDPPPEFDPTRSSLRFLYPTDFDLSSVEVPVDLFGENYYLGSMIFANPWWIVCERSPDGQRIAFASRPLLSQQPSLTLRWLDLQDLRVRTRRSIPAVEVSDLAFAPDSTRLAYFGLGSSGEGVYLADLASGQVNLLSLAEKARSLAWSPDGSQIALIGRGPWMSAWDELVVLDATSGEVVYHAPYEIGGALPGDAPLLGWGAEFLEAFPSQPAGLEACAAPPASGATP
jgi:hypothetical protein